MIELRGKKSFIVGASRGIGEACAYALAREGVDVFLIARNANDLSRVAAASERLGVRAVAHAADATDEAAMVAAVNAAEEAFGALDIVIANVGIGRYASVAETSVDDYDRIMRTNMRSTFLAAKLTTQGMMARGEGNFVIIGSVSGMTGYPGEAVYNATKFAQIGFAQSLDGEVRKAGVKVSYIAPGSVKSHFALGEGRAEGDLQHQEFLDPEDVAAAVVFAASQPKKARAFLVGLRPMIEPWD